MEKVYFRFLIIFILLYWVPYLSCCSYPATPTFFPFCIFQPIPWRIDVLLLLRVRALLPYCIWAISLPYPCIEIVLQQYSIIDCASIAKGFIYAAMFLHFYVHVLLRLALPFLRGCFLKNFYSICCYNIIHWLSTYSHLRVHKITLYFHFMCLHLLQSLTGHFLRISSSGRSV